MLTTINVAQKFSIGCVTRRQKIFKAVDSRDKIFNIACKILSTVQA